MYRLLFTCLLVCGSAGPSVRADWNQWRGPEGQGHAESALPVKWSETENVAWKTPLPGKGWSSPVIEGDRIWMTAAHETLASPEETAERLKSNTGSQPLVVLSMVRLHALCVDKKTGELLHDFEILRKENPQWSHKLNSYASPTPCGGRWESCTVTSGPMERPVSTRERQRFSGETRIWLCNMRTAPAALRSSGGTI